jgi:cardiolipin synthase
LLGVLILFLNGTTFRVRPTMLSKMTTCFQLGTVFVVLTKSHIGFFSQVNYPLFWVTGLLTISSGLHYMRYWFRVMGEGSLSD